MNILITGGCGYIGSELATFFKNRDTVVLLDNFFNSNGSVIKKIKSLSKGKIILINANVNNEALLIKIMKKYKISHVIHLSALKSVSESIKQPEKYFKNNLISTITILNAMSKSNCKNLIFSSTASIYSGSKSSLFSEKDKLYLERLNPYAMSKYLSEEFLKNACIFNKKINVVCFRYFNVAGSHKSGILGENPKKNFNNLFPSIIKSFKSKKKSFKIFGNNHNTPDGSAIRDYIHVDDVALAHIKSFSFLKKNKGFHLFNLGSGKGSSVKGVVNTFEKIIGSKIKYHIAKKRFGDPAISVASIRKAKKILKWKPERSLNDICSSVYKYFVVNQ